MFILKTRDVNWTFESVQPKINLTCGHLQSNILSWDDIFVRDRDGRSDEEDWPHNCISSPGIQKFPKYLNLFCSNQSTSRILVEGTSKHAPIGYPVEIFNCSFFGSKFFLIVFPTQNSLHPLIISAYSFHRTLVYRSCHTVEIMVFTERCNFGNKNREP